jgi:5-methylcytosine-specific restriction enzyme subunit McrC
VTRTDRPCLGRPDVTVAEWETREIPGVALTPRDRRLVDEVNATRRMTILETRNGVRVETRSWVGVLRFEEWEVRVVPKLSGGDPGVAAMVHATAGLGSLRALSGLRTLHASGATLLDLLAMLFARECESVVRAGLLSDYVEREDALPAVRGRILADRQVLERFGQVDRVICRYEERESDVWENQLLASALAQVAPRVRHLEARSHLLRLRALFADVCPSPPPEWRSPSEDDYHRLNEHYRSAHTLASLLLQSMGIRELLRAGTHRGFAFLLDMNALFERFVSRMVEHALAGQGLRVHRQRQDRLIWDVDRGAPYVRIIPDLLVEGAPGSRLSIDAKYKAYDARKLSPADVYQGFLYAQAYGGARPDGVAQAMVLFPCGGGTLQRRRLRVRDGAGADLAELTAVGVPLSPAIEELAAKGGPMLEAVRKLILERLGEA